MTFSPGHDAHTLDPPKVDVIEADQRRARGLLMEAEQATVPRDRYLAALVAAEFAATAILRVRPRRRSASRDVWRLVAVTTPEFAEWADFFSACRAKLLFGENLLVTARESDDQLRDAARFVGLVAQWISRRRGLFAPERSA